MNDDHTTRRAWTILIVDDEADMRQYLTSILEQAIPGVQILTAENGQDGLDHLARQTIDLILSDQRMPVMDGIEFLTKAARVAPNVPRVLLTAYADMDIATRAVNAGHINAFFQKPANKLELSAEITKLLQAHEATTLQQQAFARSLNLARARVAASPAQPGPGSVP